MHIELNKRELGNVLAGLRKLQREGYDESDAWIATNSGDNVKLMSQTEIDELCERINHS